MKKLIISFVVFALVGCVSNMKLPKATVGSFSPDDNANDFCQWYTGFTVFDNTRKRYRFKSDFSAIYKLGMKRGISKYGSRFVDLGDIPVKKLLDFFIRDSWDGRLTMTDEGRKYFSSNETLMKTDYFVVPWVWRENGCVVTWENGTNSIKGELISKFKVAIIRTSDFNNVGDRLLVSGSSLRDIHNPLHTFDISQEDIELFMKDMSGVIEDQVFRLLEGDDYYQKRKDIPILPN